MLRLPEAFFHTCTHWPPSEVDKSAKYPIATLLHTLKDMPISHLRGILYLHYKDDTIGTPSVTDCMDTTESVSLYINNYSNIMMITYWHHVNDAIENWLHQHTIHCKGADNWNKNASYWGAQNKMQRIGDRYTRVSSGNTSSRRLMGQ